MENGNQYLWECHPGGVVCEVVRVRQGLVLARKHCNGLAKNRVSAGPSRIHFTYYLFKLLEKNNSFRLKGTSVVFFVLMQTIHPQLDLKYTFL